MLLTHEFTDLDACVGVEQSDGEGARVGALRTGQRKFIRSGGHRPDPETAADCRSIFSLRRLYIARVTVSCINAIEVFQTISIIDTT